VHITGTTFVCDPPAPRPMAFVSHAAVKGAWRHRQIFATETTLRLLPRAATERPQVRALPIPFNRPFALGNTRVELFPSGLAPGAASLVVDVDTEGTRVGYAGTIGPAAELRPCDEVILDATFGDRDFPPREAVLAELRAWIDRGPGTLLVGSLAALSWLAELARPLGAHPVLRSRVHKARGLGVTLPPLVRAEVVLWPDDRPPPAGRVARVSGHDGAEFRLAESAGQADLVRYVVATGARAAYLIGPPQHAEALAAKLPIPARILGPPTQLALLG
jgi:putative mRNA 3-end processing factor